MTVLAALPLATPKPARPQNGRQILLHDIPWPAYRSLREVLRDRPLFLTYDEGALEIMVLSAEHERFKGKFVLLVQLLAKHFRKNFENCGSFTLQREDLEKGLEADNCYYLDSLAAIQGKRHIDLRRDPPPDLALEMDVTHSSMDRLAIYAAFKVPQVWRFDGKTLTVYVLNKGVYVASRFSPTFPGIPIVQLVKFVFLGLEKGEMVMWDKFDKWLQRFPIPQPLRKKKP